MANAPSLAAMKLMHLMIAIAGGRISQARDRLTSKNLFEGAPVILYRSLGTAFFGSHLPQKRDLYGWLNFLGSQDGSGIDGRVV